jgi:MFS transporter, DHA2 family, multidrug resistance protein
MNRLMAAKQDGLPAPQRYWAAATIWLALTISVLDGSIANVALPTIAGDLSAPPAEAIWVVNAYQLAIVISLLPMAAVGEMAGFRRVFQVGVAVFTLALLVVHLLIRFRCLLVLALFKGSARPGS